MDLREANKHPFDLCIVILRRKRGGLIYKHMNYFEHAYTGGASAPYVTPHCALSAPHCGLMHGGGGHGR